MRRLSVLFVAVLLAACSSSKSTGPGNKNNNGNNNGNSGSKTITANVNGSAFTSYSVGITQGSGYVIASGADLASTDIALTIGTTTGTQTFGTPGSIAAALLISGGHTWSAGPLYAGSSGTITVTSSTATAIIGTFSFTGVSNGQSNVVVTNGHFTINY